jgi:hypothetical protein
MCSAEAHTIHDLVVPSKLQRNGRDQRSAYMLSLQHCCITSLKPCYMADVLHRHQKSIQGCQNNLHLSPYTLGGHH